MALSHVSQSTSQWSPRRHMGNYSVDCWDSSGALWKVSHYIRSKTNTSLQKNDMIPAVKHGGGSVTLWVCSAGFRVSQHCTFNFNIHNWQQQQATFLAAVTAVVSAEPLCVFAFSCSNFVIDFFDYQVELYAMGQFVIFYQPK